MRQRIYISGKMSGLERDEILYRFSRCELWLRHQHAQKWCKAASKREQNGTSSDSAEREQARRLKIVNPCRVWPFRFPWLYRLMERVLGKATAYDLVLLYDLWLLSRCDRLHLIGSDWMTSRGAKTEQAYAQAKGITITIDVTAKQKKQ